VDEWVADMAALLATDDMAGARAAHEAWWAGFWGRSHIEVNATRWPVPPSPTPAPPPSPPPPPPAAALPVPGALLWLRASDLQATGAANGSAVARWGELTQGNASCTPTFVADALGPSAPAVRFGGTRGPGSWAGSFLASSALLLPGNGSTHFAVFKDGGSVADCCSGVVYWGGSGVGISTAPAQPGGAVDDDDGAGAGAPPARILVAMADGPGVGAFDTLDLAGRLVQVDATFDAGGARVAVGGCAHAEQRDVPTGRAGEGVMVGSRGNEPGRYFKGDVGEVIVYPRALNASEAAAVRAYLAAQWPQVPAHRCVPSRRSDKGFELSQMYAVTRYTQAIQSRNTLWPIKFDGGAFISKMGSNGEADTNVWGTCNWWQNMRLPYGAMLAAGDDDTFQVLLDYMLNQEKLLSPRTELYFGHPGMWTTETAHLAGMYRPFDYDLCGSQNRTGWPVWLENSPYLHVDWGGDSGTGEFSLMALDYLLWSSPDPSRPTRAAKDYLLLATQAAEFFMHHFTNRSADGRTVVWPAQALETFWCTWNATTQTFDNCCSNDAPTVSGMIGLFEKLLALPPGLAMPQQVADWTAFQRDLMPRLPLTADGLTIAAAEEISTVVHNCEGPELYAVHPHRVFTRGREVASGLNISLGARTVAARPGYDSYNTGWGYGLNAYALIGAAVNASQRVLVRAASAPAPGYRWPGFVQEQVFEPSFDNLANMNRALQEMLIQSGEDGFADTTIVLLPAWPCEWDVSFKLWGPLKTAVEVVYAGGKLVSLDVEPASRRSAVQWADCVPNKN